MKNKKILFVFIVFVLSLCFIPRANAQITHLYLFDANYNIKAQTTSDCWTSNDYVDVRYGRWKSNNH